VIRADYGHTYILTSLSYTNTQGGVAVAVSVGVEVAVADGVAVAVAVRGAMDGVIVGVNVSVTGVPVDTFGGVAVTDTLPDTTAHAPRLTSGAATPIN